MRYHLDIPSFCDTQRSVFLLSSCASSPRLGPALRQFYTADNRFPTVTIFAVRNDHFLAVGIDPPITEAYPSSPASSSRTLTFRRTRSDSSLRASAPTFRFFPISQRFRPLVPSTLRSLRRILMVVRSMPGLTERGLTPLDHFWCRNQRAPFRFERTEPDHLRSRVARRRRTPETGRRFVIHPLRFCQLTHA